MTYRRRSSPLHATRAGVGSLYCVVLAGVALSFEHPLILAALLLAVMLAAAGAQVLGAGGALAAVGAAVRAGDRGGQRAGGAGRADGDRALRRAAAAGADRRDARGDHLRRRARPAGADRDRVLRAALRGGRPGRAAARVPAPVVPLGADRRAGDPHGPGPRPRRPPLPRRAALPPGPPASRLALARAVTAGALDRAVDVAATLEVRGYGGSGRPARRVRPWSRHDFAFAVSAAALVALGAAAALGGWETFEAYPRLVVPVGGAELALAAALCVVALLPFADRRGIGR